VPFCYYVPQEFWNDYFPYQKGQTMTFKNEHGETKTFVVKDVYVNFGLYEPYVDDADPDPHCGSHASVGLADGDDAVRIYFEMFSNSYEKGKYSFYYALHFDFQQDALPGAEHDWWKKAQCFTNQQYGSIKSLYKLFGKTVEFEKESYGGESPDNIYDVKCVRGKGLSEFSEKKKGCTWKLVESI
jgi:hypothetical protein